MKNSEIGALIERLESEIKVVAEGVITCQEAICDVRTQVAHFAREQELLKLEVTGLGHRMDRLEGEVVSLRGEMHNEISGLRGEMHNEISGLRGEMHNEISGLRGEIADLRTDFRDFRITMEDVVLNHERRITTLENRHN